MRRVVREFVEWLFSGRRCLVELRILGGPEGPRQHFYRVPDGLDGLLATARANDEWGCEVYIGVLPRIREGGTSDDVSSYADVLWADVDAKGHDFSKQAALDAILDFPIPPSVIVDSGHGYHAYWKLDSLYEFDRVQRVMKGLARRIGGDAVYDRARILRLPGLSNHKDGGNAPVRLIRFDTTLKYPLSDLAEYAYAEPRPLLNNNGYLERQTADFPSGIDFTFDPGRGARSEHDFGVVCHLIEHGWYDSEIVTAFLENPTGIGAKTANAGTKYLERTIAKAHGHVSLVPPGAAAYRWDHGPLVPHG
jgi:hypothetical protein